LLNGCASTQKKAKVIYIDKTPVSAITYPAELRGAYFIVSQNNKVNYCAEPAPDVAMDSLQKLAASITAQLPADKKIEGKLDTELSNKVVQLAGRTQLILLAREMLYRSCELTMNYPDAAGFNQALTMYMRVADLVQDLGKTDRTLAEAELLRVSFGKDKNSQCIQNWLDKNSNNSEVLKEWLDKNAGGISIPAFVYGKEYAGKRSEFIQTIKIKCD
jgi:hypothetical protein